MKINHISDTVTLHNGVEMPWLGLGVYKVQEGNEVEQAVEAALRTGYRSIDTAAYYQNEQGVGRAVRASGIPREQIFITTKVWNTDQGYDETLRAFEDSSRKLDLDYVDLYLIHWPVPGKFKDTWRALEKLYLEGRVRAIGVSNFLVHHLRYLLAEPDLRVKPMVNQVEFHPRLYQQELLQFCRENEIQLEAWSPLMRGKIFDHPVVQQLSQKYDKTPAQIVLRWELQHGVIVIPKSIREERIRENAGIFDFQLAEDEMEQMNGLHTGERVGPHPDHFGY